MIFFSKIPGHFLLIATSIQNKIFKAKNVGEECLSEPLSNGSSRAKLFLWRVKK